MRLFLAVVFTVISWLSRISAFCFYSTFEEGVTLQVQQYSNWGGNYWQKFNAEIEPGGMACCHYQNKDCNNAETQNEDTVFLIYCKPSLTNHAGVQDIHVPSGGYARIGGNYHKPDVYIFDAFDNPYHYTGPPVDEFSH